MLRGNTREREGVDRESEGTKGKGLGTPAKLQSGPNGPSLPPTVHTLVVPASKPLPRPKEIAWMRGIPCLLQGT